MYSEGLLLLVAGLALANGQVFLPQYVLPPPLQQAVTYQQPRVDLAHPEVVLNSQAEAQLPPHLLNPFYKNPRIAQALAKESWFGPGEMHVAHREAEKIPRTRIFSVLKNAGLARRR
ncbi:uncharacterized protein LOC106672322 [Cimex lectularius]|uniref:Uncharacterized protein n=1 Tax=Cimex lectularius TaxID=79782 RepID=A0A8I6SHA7_CIMLE|nr:uncharacterized protein LOC106672322 [Cimex lectularius]